MIQDNRFKEDLLAAISDLFLRFGLRSTSMDDICGHLKISKKTLYQIFENKDDVVEQVAFYRLRKRLEENTPDGLQVNAIRFLHDIKIHILADLNSQLPANYFDLKKYHPQVYQRLQQEEVRVISDLMDRVLKKGVKDGFLRAEADMKLQLYLLTRQLGTFREQEMLKSADYPVPVLLSAIMNNFILILSTPKGKAEFERILKEEQDMLYFCL